MKCPKCHYISFDYNQVCPKCNKDISVEQEKLNIPAFKPAPLSLLGGLLGDVQPGARLSGSADVAATHHEHAASLEDASNVGTGQVELDDSQELDLGLDVHEDKEGLNLEGILEEPGSEIEPGAIFDDSPADKEPTQTEKTEIVGTISMDEADVFPGIGQKKKEDKEEISLDLEEITLETVQPDQKVTPDNTEDKMEADLGDFSLEDAGVNLEKSEPSPSDTGELVLELGLMSGKDEKVPGAKQRDEIILSLDDLKVNETGELEIGRDIAASSSAKEPAQTDPLSVEVKTETAAPEDKEAEDDLSLLLGDDAIEVSSADPAEGAPTIDLENLDLELDLEGPERK